MGNVEVVAALFRAEAVEEAGTVGEERRAGDAKLGDAFAAILAMGARQPSTLPSD